MVEGSGNGSPAVGESWESARVLVVIVNYRTADLVVDCLRSLVGERAALSGMRVVVTDNASEDGSVERIGQAIEAGGWSEWVRVQRLEKNGGFCYGNNEAIRPALGSAKPPDVVYLLNPDTVVRPGAVVELVRYLGEHGEAAMVGSRLEDPDGTPQRSAFRFITPGSELLSASRLGLIRRLRPGWEVAMEAADEPHRADWLAGASILVRREVFERIGLLDEGYFLYFDEVDFCLRARRAGLACWYVPSSRVVHLVGAATGVSETRKKAKRRPAYWFESRKRYFVKNWGRSGALLADVCWMVGLMIWRMKRWVRRHPDLDPPRFVRDFLSHTVWVRGFGA